MDFFNAQRHHKRRSLQLYGLFFLAIGLHALVLYAVIAFIFILFQGSLTHWVFITASLVTLGTFIIVSWVEYHRLKAGGRAIAKRVGAVRLFIDHSVDQMMVSRGIDSTGLRATSLLPKVLYRPHQIVVRDPKDFPSEYRRYHEVAEQMAIAAGIRPPILYVLPDEKGINGFVAGRDAEDTVMVLTQGALENLTDEGLYGLIAHEYGHILHGDARFNLHLMVVLAGLQLFYDWSSPVDNSLDQSGDYMRLVTQQQQVLKKQLSAQMTLPSEPIPAQSIVDQQARQIEQQTADFDDYGQWVAYWRQQSQSPTALAQQIKSINGERAISSRAPANNDLVTLLLHLFSFSSMLSAQLIKHSFNRQRELLADATSVQLTRSPAIMETLRTIHQHPLGSRLSVTPETHGLSHFFFASSSMDLGDSSWFSTHPSLSERMQSIDRGDYEVFARKVAQQRQINQQVIKDIYEQRRQGTWGVMKSADTVDSPPLELPVSAEVVVDGRLQTEGFRADLRADAGFEQLLYPYTAKPDAELPTTSIALADVKRITLPQRINDYRHHPLGALGLIEAILLCHQYHCIDAYEPVTLRQLWQGQEDWRSDDSEITKEQLKAGQSNHQAKKADAKSSHSLNVDLLDMVARLDRRMDSGLIERTCLELARHNLSAQTLQQADERRSLEHSHEAARDYQTLKRHHETLTQYLEALEVIIESTDSTSSGLNQLADNNANKDGNNNKSANKNAVNKGDEQSVDDHKVSHAGGVVQRLNISPIWLAGHLYLFIEAAQSALAKQWESLDNQVFIDCYL
ncbi:MAG: M48 family metalloprotease, partial [Psychrobacter sp.]|nr:M48 family metalloprotease [Psychrobacter sp.]